MRVGFYQFAPIFGDKTANLNKVENRLKSVNADLIVLPELFNTGYLFLNKKELLPLTEPIPEGETTQRLLALTAVKNFSIVAGIAERFNNKIYNSAVLITPKGKVFVYRKAHLFFKEKFIFEPGDTGFNLFNIGRIRIGILICFDYIFPEAARTLMLKGAQIICHPSNLILPYGPRIVISRAVENRVFFILSNRIGKEKRKNQELNFTGLSLIVTPKGKVLYQAPQNREALKIVTIEPKAALNKNVTRYNNIKTDRRKDLYQL